VDEEGGQEMGTDIHLFVEHRVRPGGEFFSLSDGEFNLPRDYEVFAALAGVRTDELPSITPRGFPEDASSDAYQGYYHRVSDEGQYFDGWWFIERPADAQSYVDRGLSHKRSWGNVELVSDPDAHHATWLSRSELLTALSRDGIDAEKLSPEYRVVVAALDLLADRDGRVVFWFDS
jgi:hypothetical protein